MPMKFKQIQAFITVAHEGNMTLAAEKMGITQSGLSRLLLSLEADLSATLFEILLLFRFLNTSLTYVREFGCKDKEKELSEG